MRSREVTSRPVLLQASCPVASIMSSSRPILLQASFKSSSPVAGIMSNVGPTRRHGHDWNGTVGHGANTARHSLAEHSLAWQMKVGGLANISEWLAIRNEGLEWSGWPKAC